MKTWLYPAAGTCVMAAFVAIPLLLSAANSFAVPSSRSILWGAMPGDAEDAAEFERRVGSPLPLQATFVHWGNENAFPSDLISSGRATTLVIFWEAMDYNEDETDQPKFSYQAILNGDYDEYIASFAQAAAVYGRPVILIPFEEMNGDWYPWSGTKNGNSPEKHRAAFRYVHSFFREVPTVKFGWTVNGVSVPDSPGNSIASYYPGDDVVDYVGIDGFNFGDPWQTFDEVFSSALSTVRGFGKPVLLTSLACREGKQKAAWITDALTVQIPRHPEIVGWIWFNENKEKDWRVWSDGASLAAFKRALP